MNGKIALKEQKYLYFPSNEKHAYLPEKPKK
jgi:hypothetical protein